MQSFTDMSKWGYTIFTLNPITFQMFKFIFKEHIRTLYLLAINTFQHAYHQDHGRSQCSSDLTACSTCAVSPSLVLCKNTH